MIKRKKAFEMNFSWMFALIAGAFILFAAIYGVSQFIKSGSSASNTILAKQLSTVFNPLETGSASGKIQSVDLSIQTKVFLKCSTESPFGYNKISALQKTGFKEKTAGEDIILYNKYIFSNKTEEGKKIYLFSKPFEMPFKISEIIFMTGDNYCFEDAPDFILDEIERLQPENIRIKENGNCTGKERKVCFNKDCEISVYPDCTELECSSEYEIGYTEKNGKRLYFTGSLIYASIFSDSDIYNCNVKRLMMRLKEITYLYEDELKFISSECGTIASSNLAILREKASFGNFTSLDLKELKNAAEKVRQQNQAQDGCKIFE